MSRDSRDNSNMYANVFSFLNLPFCEDISDSDADVAILGLPYDLATSGRPGTRSGPNAIRQASSNLRWEEARWPWPFELQDRLRVTDCGDVQFYQGDHEAFVAECERRAAEIIGANKKLLSFGGDHYVALPLLRQHAKKYGKLALIHFDAHTDTDEDGWLYDHGAMFHHARMEGLLDEQRCVQVGIRTWYEPGNHPFRVIDANQACAQSAESVSAAIAETVGDGPAYISFDIDCLDPAFAPGTGTPVAGGLSSNQALSILRGLQGLELVGMDVVEVAPAYDHSQITALAAATLGLEFLYLLAAGRGD
ncbi:MAG: agmatinase [Halieaceae bacterium]